MGQKILHILNEPADLQDSLQQVIATVKASIGIDAVGIRLQKGDDYPYYAQEGFSLEFLEKENSLVYRSKEGGLCRDANGKPLLECTCGLVISGKADLSNPLFTRGGSAWTNDSLPLLDLPADHDPRTHPRNTCIHHQYASIALVPIRAKGVIIGLLHLNDRRTGRFTIETVQLLEAIGENIGESLLRKQEETEREKLEAQLHQSQKLESIGHLAGGIAHDFNNMLSVISGYSEIVLSKMNASDPNYSRVQEINKAGKRSADLTRQLLTFARKQTIVPKILDLNVSVAGMLNMLQRLIGENIKLIWMPAANLWKVKMDPSQIDQILANLIVNTRDAISGIGKVIIEIGNAELDEAFCKGHLDFTPGKYVVLSVSDNGCGMSKETIDHIFEPFFTTKKVGEGTGLGLATVFGIVKQNDGFINVYSEPGKGTAFKIYLPRHESENVGQEDKHEKTKRITGIETVLLVEDETAMLQFVKSQLEDLGYTVLTTDRPIKAIKIAGEYKGDIHLLMTDVVMPEMSGRDLKEKINQIRSGIKCLFMSGYSKNIMSHNGGIDEGIHFLQKPFTIEALSVKVREALA
jgi:signal transduction histidine kinase